MTEIFTFLPGRRTNRDLFCCSPRRSCRGIWGDTCARDERLEHTALAHDVQVGPGNMFDEISHQQEPAERVPKLLGLLLIRSLVVPRLIVENYAKRADGGSIMCERFHEPILLAERSTG